MILSRVDLPHPEGPKREKNSPVATSSDTSDRTRVAPKFLVTRLIESDVMKLGISLEQGFVQVIVNRVVKRISKARLLQRPCGFFLGGAVYALRATNKQYFRYGV